MATISLPGSRATRQGRSLQLDPSLLIPIVGCGLLLYLTVFPLLMLVLGSFERDVGPRETAFTLQNYADAYASKFTYSTFVSSLGFATGAAALAFVMSGI